MNGFSGHFVTLWQLLNFCLDRNLENRACILYALAWPTCPGEGIAQRRCSLNIWWLIKYFAMKLGPFCRAWVELQESPSWQLETVTGEGLNTDFHHFKNSWWGKNAGVPCLSVEFIHWNVWGSCCLPGTILDLGEKAENTSFWSRRMVRNFPSWVPCLWRSSVNASWIKGLRALNFWKENNTLKNHVYTQILNTNHFFPLKEASTVEC